MTYDTATAAPPPGDAATYDPPALLPRIVRRWWLLVLVAVLAAAVGYVVSSSSDSVYETEAQVQISSGTANIVLGPNLVPQSDDRRVATESAILSSDRVRLAAEKASGGDLPDLEVRTSAGSDILSAVVRDSDPGRAAAAANAYVDAYLAIGTQRTAEQLQPAIDVAQKDINRLNSTIADAQAQLLTPAVTRDATGEQAAAIQNRLTSLLAQRVTSTQAVERLNSAVSLGTLDVRLLASAEAPDDKVAPRPARIALVAGALALAIAIVVAGAVPLRRRRRSRKAPA